MKASCCVGWFFLTGLLVNGQIAPTIITHPLSQTASAGTTVTLSTVAAGSAPLTYIWTKDRVVVPGVTGPNLTFTSVQASDAGTYRVVARNHWGSITSQEAKLTVTGGIIPAPPANRAPELAPIGPQTVDEERPLSFIIGATDPDGADDTLTYSALGLPDGASFYPITRVFFWIPREDQSPGIYSVVFRVEDSGAPKLNDEEQVTITVAEINDSPVITSVAISDDSGRVIGLSDVILVGQRVSLSSTFADPDQPDTHTAFIRWGDGEECLLTEVTAGQAFTIGKTQSFVLAGQSEIIITVTDGSGLSGTATRQINVVDPVTGMDSLAGDLAVLAGSVSSEAAPFIDAAIGVVVGQNGGTAKNGAVSMLDQGNTGAALVKLRQAIEELQAAAVIDPSPELTAAMLFLTVAAATVVTEEVEAAGIVATKALDKKRVDEARTLIQIGRALCSAGSFLDAIDTFQSAQKLVQSIG